jgi:hypothetical protein
VLLQKSHSHCRLRALPSRRESESGLFHRPVSKRHKQLLSGGGLYAPHYAQQVAAVDFPDVIG